MPPPLTHTPTSLALGRGIPGNLCLCPAILPGDTSLGVTPVPSPCGKCSKLTPGFGERGQCVRSLGKDGTAHLG